VILCGESVESPGVCSPIEQACLSDLRGVNWHKLTSDLLSVICLS